MKILRSLVLLGILWLIASIPLYFLESSGFHSNGFAGFSNSKGLFQVSMICFAGGVLVFMLNMILDSLRPSGPTIQDIAAVEDHELREKLLAGKINSTMRPTVIPGAVSTLPVVVFGPGFLIFSWLLRIFGR